MKCAVLCNGPSRVLYSPKPEYSLIIGCNVPWTYVDSTVVLDDWKLIEAWVANPTLITCPVYFSDRAWKKLNKLDPDSPLREQQIGKLIKTMPHYHSSGHVAAEIALARGYTELDIFGCDSYSHDTIVSTSWDLIDQGGRSATNMNIVRGWRKRWNLMQLKHPNVVFTFFTTPEAQ